MPIRLFNPQFTNPHEAQILEGRDNWTLLITDLLKGKVVHHSNHKTEAVLLEQLLCLMEANNWICDVLSVQQQADNKKLEEFYDNQ